jgi:hypothetical protein
MYIGQNIKDTLEEYDIESNMEKALDKSGECIFITHRK